MLHVSAILLTVCYKYFGKTATKCKLILHFFFWYFNLVLVCSVSSEQVTNCYSRNYSDVSGWGRQLIFFSDRNTVFLLKKLWACFFMKSSLMALLREKKMGVPITSRAYKSPVGSNQRQFIQTFVVRVLCMAEVTQNRCLENYNLFFMLICQPLWYNHLKNVIISEHPDLLLTL